jgi:hypothetical protein
MITNKDIRVENGFLIINGDKYPLDGQSPEAIMAIVEDNSDTTPTAESSAPVTSNGIKEYVDNLIGYIDKKINAETSGHSAPVRSSGGAYYETLVDYSSLGVERDKIICITVINWTGITKQFTLYNGVATVSAITDSATTIYANDPSANIILRIMYKR